MLYRSYQYLRLLIVAAYFAAVSSIAVHPGRFSGAAAFSFRHRSNMNRPRRGAGSPRQPITTTCEPCNDYPPSVNISILSSSLSGGETPSSSDDEGLAKSGGSGSKWDEWKERILKISNIASILCVIDCTVLPAVTIFLPIIGVAASAEQAKWLHELGHSIALFFVLPVGGLAATMNYLTHKRAQLSALAAIGLTLIYAANGHGGPILSRLPHGLAHKLHCGSWLHRITNLVGCACLLGSNYLSHKIGCAHKHIVGSCSHDH